MNDSIRILDVVALIADLPEHRLFRGQVGTAVEQLSENVFEVEFSDDEGKTYAMVPIDANRLMVLHYEPVRAAQTGSGLLISTK
jgi:hypothetical protein